MLTPLANIASSSRCRIIASVTSAMWNSSKQIRRIAPGDAPAQFVQRVHRAVQVLQLAMHLAHEFVEVQSCLALQRHRLVEAVHQEALAAADPAVHVDPARNRRAA